MQEGQFITHPDIADGFSCPILRVFGGYVCFELPDGKQQSIAINSPRGRALTVSDTREDIMPIKGLTTNSEGRLPYIGIIRKGGPMQEREKNGKPYKIVGKDLDYFRFTSDDADVAKRFLAIFGDKPEQITVQLPFTTTDENFDAWKEAWAAGGLVHRCDGETMARWQTPDGNYSDDPKPCTGGCKEVGRLKVFIRELGRMALVTVLTSSKHDIVNIHGALKVLEKQRGSLTGIPFVLKRKEVEISANENGKRVTRKKWLIHIEPAPEWAAQLLAAQATAALPTGQPLALSAAPDLEPEDEGDAHEAEMITDAQQKEIKAICEDIQRKPEDAASYFFQRTLAELTLSQADELLGHLKNYRQQMNKAA